MSAFLAKFFSWVLQPLLMPTYAVILFFYFNSYLLYSISPVMQRIIMIIVLGTTFFMPVITTLLLLYRGSIRSLEMENKADRTIPFVTTAGYYLICFWLLWQLPIPRTFSTLILGALVTVILALIINNWWKISIHMIGIGGLTGSVYALSQILVINLMFPLMALVFFSGILGTSRLIREAHTPAQLYTGFLVGFFVEWILLTLMQ